VSERVSQRISSSTALEINRISGSDVADVSCKLIVTVNLRGNSANHSHARLRARDSGIANVWCKRMPQFVIVGRNIVETAAFSYRADRRLLGDIPLGSVVGDPPLSPRDG